MRNRILGFRREGVRRGHRRKRQGSILVFSAVLLIGLLGVLALSVDTGYMYTMQTQLDRSVDAAALAGAGALVEGQDLANEAVVEYLVRNPVGAGAYVTDEDLLEVAKAQFLAQHQDDLQVRLGHWNSETGEFEEGGQLPSTLNVSLRYNHLPLFFGRIFGRDAFSLQAEAIAMYRPRDIMLVLDFSASMNDDSELKSIDSLGQATVEASIHQMWEDLDFPAYGNLQYEPQWVTIPGEGLPASVTWRTSEVDVAAETNMQAVKLYFSNGASQTFSTTASSGTWAGTGGNSGYRITKCKVEIGGQWETFDFYSNAAVRRGLALDGVAYPSSGSWDDYIEYARSHSSSMPWYDWNVYHAGYRRKFGMLTLINFWNKNKPVHSQTPDLWKVSAQPVTAVKDAVDVFMDYVRLVDAQDRVGLAIYDAPDGNAVEESGLTFDLDQVVTIARERQAGHYHRYTNIGAGMQTARETLQQTGRENALKMIVLMTDGQANWVNGGYSTTAARQYVLDEAAVAESLNYPIVTISLGVEADTALMQEVADITDGLHFNVPGGQSVQGLSADLMAVFRAIADARPLKLVK